MFSSTDDVSLREEMCLAWSDVGYMKNEFVLWHCIPLGTLIQEVQAILLKHEFQHGICQFPQDVVFLAPQSCLSCSHISPANCVRETMKNSLPVTSMC